MNFIYLFVYLFNIVNCDKKIRNIELPSCKNCVYYKPNNFDMIFKSSFNKCEKFGEKNIITDNIINDYVNDCRKDESKCGKEGKFFEGKKKMTMKIIQYIINYLLFQLSIITILILIFPKIVFAL